MLMRGNDDIVVEEEELLTKIYEEVVNGEDKLNDNNVEARDVNVILDDGNTGVKEVNLE